MKTPKLDMSDMFTDPYRLIAGKNIAIVGNAQSIFDKTNGQEIDQHDTIIRFNRGFIIKAESQGTRTDILIMACPLTDEERLSFGALSYINRSKRIKSGRYTFTNKFRAWLKTQIGAMPSSGLMAIQFCRAAYAKNIDLYGFDFEETPTFYNPEGYVTKHNYAKEKEIIKDMEAKNILKIH